MKISLLVTFFISFSLLSQNTKEEASIAQLYFNKIQQLDILEAEKLLINSNNNKTVNQLKIHLDIIRTNGYVKHNSIAYLKSINLNSPKKNNGFLLDLLLLSEQETLYNNNRIRAYDIAHMGFKLSEELKNETLQKEFLVKILKIYTLGIISNDKNVSFYLQKLLELSQNQPIYLFKHYVFSYYLNEIGLLNSDKASKIKTKRAISNRLIEKLDSITQLFLKPTNNLFIEYYHLKGLNCLSEQKHSEATGYFNKEVEFLQSKKEVFYYKYKYENLKEIARNLSHINKHKEAIIFLKKSRSYENKQKTIRNRFVYNLYISEMYNGLHKTDSAFIALKNAFELSFLLNFEKQNNLISSLEVKNKTKETAAKLILEEEKGKRQKTALYGAFVVIFLGSTIGLLVLKNSRKKHQLALKEKEIERHKNLSFLKEQELTTINAMIDGQEKERRRIAEDLHDNLGAVLATLKLHFENLKFNEKKNKLDQNLLFEKTENLIDEAYLKVRSIAHAKNAGVIASQGLLSSIQLMASKITAADKICIEVVHFGLDKRLENSLEIGVFRIIQELITNILKHAQASQATINLSLYDQILTVIVEDNGKGFDMNATNLNDSMGIHSIETRIEHLKGTLSFDSTAGKGTTVILNIPIT